MVWKHSQKARRPYCQNEEEFPSHSLTLTLTHAPLLSSLTLFSRNISLGFLVRTVREFRMQEIMDTLVDYISSKDHALRDVASLGQQSLALVLHLRTDPAWIYSLTRKAFVSFIIPMMTLSRRGSPLTSSLSHTLSYLYLPSPLLIGLKIVVGEIPADSPLAKSACDKLTPKLIAVLHDVSQIYHFHFLIDF